MILKHLVFSKSGVLFRELVFKFGIFKFGILWFLFFQCESFPMVPQNWIETNTLICHIDVIFVFSCLHPFSTTPFHILLTNIITSNPDRNTLTSQIRTVSGELVNLSLHLELRLWVDPGV